MKKILLASTALVAFAGAAAAEVTVSGSAELGIYGGKGLQTKIFQDIDVTFKMSGETDGGLSFGAAIDLDEAQDNCTAAVGAPVGVSCVNNALDNVDAHGGVAIFVSGDFGTVTVGDTDGAMDWALQDAGNTGNPGSIDDSETTHAGYMGAYGDGKYDGQVVRYDNTFGDFGVALSFELDDAGLKDTGFAIGVKYNIAMGAGNVALGLGYQTWDTTPVAGGSMSIIGLTAATTFDNGLSASLGYVTGDVDNIADSNHLALGLGYSMDALSLHLNYGKYDYGNNTSKHGVGIAAAYDLGGGLAVKAAYGSSESVAKVSSDSFSLGLAMSF